MDFSRVTCVVTVSKVVTTSIHLVNVLVGDGLKLRDWETITTNQVILSKSDLTILTISRHISSWSVSIKCGSLSHVAKFKKIFMKSN